MKNTKNLILFVIVLSFSNLPVFSMEDVNESSPKSSLIVGPTSPISNDLSLGNQSSHSQHQQKPKQNQASSSTQPDITDDIEKFVECFTYKSSLDSYLESITNDTISKINSKLNDDKQEQGFNTFRTVESYYKEMGKEMPYASILSLDGGGFRGLMEAYWLAHLENKDITNRKPYQLFNIIAGTSIGGILALASSVPGKKGDFPALTTDEMVDLFVTNGSKIFPQRLKYNYPGKLWDFVRSPLRTTYDSKPLEDLLVNYFSHNPLRSSFTNIIVTSATTNTQEPFLFSSFHSQTNHYEAWRVARCTSAAPTFFKAYSDIVLPGKFAKESLVDGGLWVNNPSAIAYGAALKGDWIKDNRDMVLPENIIMLSLGTGRMPVQYRQPDDAGWLNSARPVIEAMMNYSANGVHQSMNDWLQEKYLRINPKLEKNILLDSIDSQTVQLLKTAAEDEYEKIDDFVKDGKLRTILERDPIKEKY